MQNLGYKIEKDVPVFYNGEWNIDLILENDRKVFWKSSRKKNRNL